MRTAFFYLLLLVVCFNLKADEANQIRIQQVPTGGTHNNLPIPADQPDVYYDDDNQEVIIDGGGFISSYNVEIASAGTLAVVISTQVNGTYDTIDVSSLPSDHVYVITIYSPTGNTYEGTFDTY